MKGKKLSLIVFFIIQLSTLAWTIGIFVLPLMNLNSKPEKYYDEKTGIYADTIIQAINSNNLTLLKKEFIDKNENLENSLKSFGVYLAHNKIESIELVDCSYTKTKYTSLISDKNNKSAKLTLFTYSVKFEQGFFGLLYLETVEENNTLKLRTLKINPIEKSIEEMHNFYGYDMFGSRLYLLLLVLLLNGFIMYTEYDYIKKAAKPKIWMQIAMIISILSIDINWTSLMLNIQLLKISIFPASIFSYGRAGDWHLTYYLPIIAILYWIVFRKEILQEKDNNTAKINEE